MVFMHDGHIVRKVNIEDHLSRELGRRVIMNDVMLLCNSEVHNVPLERGFTDSLLRAIIISA